MNFRRTLLAVVAFAVSLLPGFAPGAFGPAEAATPAPASSPIGAPPLAAPSAPPAPQQYANFVKSAARQSGLIDVLHKEDDVYFDLGAEQFGHPFIVAPVLATGVGSEAFAGRVFPTFLLEFVRVGRRVLWIQKNTDYSAPPDSAAANSLAISVTESVINSTPIVAEDEDRGRVVISASFFLSDFESVGRDLGGSQGPVILLGAAARTTFAVDPTRSYFERTKAFPQNDELLASLAFVGPAGASVAGAPDARGVRLRMHYSIVNPPEASSYVPRLADDRIGYFTTDHKRFSDDSLRSPVVRYIDRWNFNRGPIVYYLTDEIPPQYKPTIRAALLAWNPVFAKAGVPNAIEVREQPKEPGWDPDDARYNAVRWITSDQPAFAGYGPHIADPMTGEILRAEIVIDGEALRSLKRGYTDQVAPLHPAAAAQPACADLDVCETFEQDSAAFAATGTLALQMEGASYEQTQQYALEWLRAAVLHEAGHNFGLRHNFRGSELYPLARLHDRSFTGVHGLTSSVMDYLPVNLSPPGTPQGDYFQRRPGPYDAWAIRFGYERFAGVTKPSDETGRLAAIAGQSTRPEYAYATDEDAVGPYAIDPRISAFDLSSDPLAFEANQFAVVDALIGKLDRAFPRDGRSYAEERLAFLTIMRTYSTAAMLSAKYVGGVYTSRAHRGQSGASPPLAAVPRTVSRKAFDLIADHLFSSRALRFSPRLLADLGANHFGGESEVLDRPDFPISDFVAALQDSVTFTLFSPEVMSRLADQPLRTDHPADTMSLGDLFEWMQAAAWDGIGPRMGPLDPLHRAFQRRYATLLVAFSLAPSFTISAFGYPSDSPALARYELQGLAKRLDAGLSSPSLDVATRAHLEDLHSRVRHALDPNSMRGA
ncbi:MAG: zinc-dependent metalloprotease [Vulcanimicrobiaceae bacterium]